jgi:hypothetical protein
LEAPVVGINVLRHPTELVERGRGAGNRICHDDLDPVGKTFVEGVGKGAVVPAGQGGQAVEIHGVLGNLVVLRHAEFTEPLGGFLLDVRITEDPEKFVLPGIPMIHESGTGVRRVGKEREVPSASGFGQIGNGVCDLDTAFRVGPRLSVKEQFEGHNEGTVFGRILAGERLGIPSLRTLNGRRSRTDERSEGKAKLSGHGSPHSSGSIICRGWRIGCCGITIVIAVITVGIGVGIASGSGTSGSAIVLTRIFLGKEILERGLSGGGPSRRLADWSLRYGSLPRGRGFARVPKIFGTNVAEGIEGR